MIRICRISSMKLQAIGISEQKDGLVLPHRSAQQLHHAAAAAAQQGGRQRLQVRPQSPLLPLRPGEPISCICDMALLGLVGTFADQTNTYSPLLVSFDSGKKTAVVLTDICSTAVGCDGPHRAAVHQQGQGRRRIQVRMFLIQCMPWTDGFTGAACTSH